MSYSSYYNLYSSSSNNRLYHYNISYLSVFIRTFQHNLFLQLVRLSDTQRRNSIDSILEQDDNQDIHHITSSSQLEKSPEKEYISISRAVITPIKQTKKNARTNTNSCSNKIKKITKLLNPLIFKMKNMNSENNYIYKSF